jgi:hypothetical protein
MEGIEFQLDLVSKQRQCSNMGSKETEPMRIVRESFCGLKEKE